MNYIDIAKEVLRVEANELLNACAKVGDNFEKATNLISSISGKLIITGVGKSGLVGAKMAATFASTGTSSFFLHPTEAMHGDLGMIGKGDAVLAISYSGESDELIKIIPHIKRFDIPLIAMAGFEDSTLGRNCDIFIDVNVKQEACPLNAAPTSSTTLTMAMGDALAVCLMKKKNFQKEDFASFHPGGSLGKRLFLKISDLLRTQNLPIVSRGTILKDALISLSEGRMGNVIVLDEEDKVFGIFSDGDLRRAIMRNDFDLSDKVEKYATKSPKIINDKNILASDALKIVENYKIQVLIIADKNGRLEGLLHIHDLIEAGIK